MTLKQETISQIQALLQADPALLTQIQSLDEPADAAAILVKAAAAKGVDVNAVDVVALAESARAAQGAMSDAELEQVAGGLSPFFHLSIRTLGFGCAVISIIDASHGQACGTTT